VASEQVRTYGPAGSLRLALKSWQEILAAIHDNDAFIQQLEDSKKTPQVKALIDQVSRERSENYQKFTSLIEERPVFKVKN